MIIVAVNPGKLSGVALLGKGGAASIELPTYEAIRYVETLLEVVDLVVCESIIPRSGVLTWQPDALELLGALRYLTRKAGVDFELQSLAAARAFAEDDTLERLGWRNSSKGGHADDALRHLLVAAVRHGVIDPKQIVREEE